MCHFQAQGEKCDFIYDKSEELPAYQSRGSGGPLHDKQPLTRYLESTENVLSSRYE